MPFFTGGPDTLSSVQQQGNDGLRSTFGQSFGASLAEGAMETPVMRLAGAGLRVGAGSLGGPLQPDEANRRYGLPGLKFDKPITDALAGDLWNDRKTQLLRDQAVASGPRNIFARGANFAGGLIPQFLDPINAASVVVPGLGEEAVGAALVRGAMVADRIGATGAAEGLAGASGGLADASAALNATRAGRIAKGAASGVVGQAALEPINYELDQSEHRDWSMNQALVNLAFGAVLGGAAGGLSRSASGVGRDLAEDAERGAGEAEAAQPQPQPMPGQDRIDALMPDRRGSVLNEAVSAMTQDRPSVAPELADHLSLAEPEAEYLRNALPNIPSYLDDEARTAMSRAKTGDSLLSFLVKRGGIRDEAGELRTMEVARRRVGLVRTNGGMTLDDARRAAAEAGYLPHDSYVSDFLNLIDDEARGKKQFADPQDAMIAEQQARLASHYERDAADLDLIHHDLDRAEESLGTRLNQFERNHAALAMISDYDVTPIQAAHDAMMAYSHAVRATEQIDPARLDADFMQSIAPEGVRNRNAQRLTDAATRAVMDEPADVTAARQAVDRVTRDAPNFPGTDLDADAAEAERMAGEANNQLAALMGDEELAGVDRDISDVFDQAASDLEGDAKAYDSVASCLWRNS